jgi:hypothetical protein
MSEDPTPAISAGRVGILVPCSANEFGDFISRLLGKPQIATGSHGWCVGSRLVR